MSGSQVLDDKSDWFVFSVWFFAGLVAVAAMQLSVAAATGGVAGLLNVGEEHSARRVIEQEMLDVPLAPGIGHDGQLYYVMALDPLGNDATEVLGEFESVGYRYRRIGYPAVSGLFGVLGGERLVWSMAIVNAIGAAVAAGSTALIARTVGGTSWAAIAVVLNPGVWASSQISTGDNLALGAGLLAVLFFLHRRILGTVVALVISILTKETGIAFAIGLLGYAWTSVKLVPVCTSGFLYPVLHKKTLAVAALGIAAPIVLWYAYVHINIGNVLDSSGNLGLPFGGLVEAALIWPAQTGWENVRVAVAVASLILALASFLYGNRFWKWLTLPWAGIAMLSSHLVWDLGNNAIRTLAPLTVLVTLTLMDRKRAATQASP